MADAGAFGRWLVPLRGVEWVVYAKRPFAGLEAVLAYLSRYTHRVAISNRRLVAMDEKGVSFRWKDYRAKGRTRHKTMMLAAEEFMRRFVLPRGFHRIRHYGLLANAGRQRNLATARAFLDVSRPEPDDNARTVTPSPTFVCPCCGSAMQVIEIVMRRQPIRAPPRSTACCSPVPRPHRHAHSRRRAWPAVAQGRIARIPCLWHVCSSSPSPLSVPICTLPTARCVNHRSSREPRLVSNPHRSRPA